MLIALTQSACVTTTTGIGGIDLFGWGKKPTPSLTVTDETVQKKVCGAWGGISWSKNDTDQTIKEIKRNNAAHDSWCGPGVNKKK